MTLDSNALGSDDYRLIGVACESRFGADRLRARAFRPLDAPTRAQMMTVAAAGRGHVCTHSSLVNGPGVEITWWELLIAACFRWADARMVWGVPIALVWQAVGDSNIAVAEVERLAGLVEPGGSALFWLEEKRKPVRALRYFSEGQATQDLELPVALKRRLDRVIRHHSLVA